ncbi:MAG: ATP-binding protein [Pseudohongiella sp.]|nr:ATP-binding protein [Pseudohongiella sp.]
MARSAISVACSVKALIPDTKSSDVVKTLVNNTLKAQGYRTIEKTTTVLPLPAVYDPALVNCDSDLVLLAQGIVKASSARLCLYGPPGTGKTAYAHWLAKQLDLPLIVKKSSDLLGMFVGQTEKNIAEAFEQAREEPGVLLIDEVDGLLQDRRSLRAGWEVTMVNELLTQMESFDGIFIASTNLANNLDQAALRRFDLKLRLDYLAPEQAVQLTRRCLESLDLPTPDNSWDYEIRMLTNLTPGDFATATRRHKFSPIGSAQEFVAVLQAECAAKEEMRRPIGFVH